MARGGIDPLVRTLEVWRDETVSPKARSARLARTARDEIDKAQRINRVMLGGEPHYDVFVDGRKGAAVETVKPDGVVLAEWIFLAPVLRFVAENLRKASPVLTGQYRDAHLLIIDGKEHELTAEMPEVFTEAVFISSVPYARKIERGLSRQAPDGVYQVIAGLANRRFGNLANVSYAWRALTGTTALNKWAESTSLQKQGRRTMGAPERADWLRRQPAIFVEPY